MAGCRVGGEGGWVFAMSKTPLLLFLLVAPLFLHAQVDDPEVKVFLDKLFKEEGPKAGEKAPDFTLERVTGGNLKASELWAQKPLVVTTGSYTCPQFREVTSLQDGLMKE